MGNIKTYEGDRPYIFISYAHANSPAVMEVVEALAEQGYRIWYDDGIEVGSEWQEYIAGHLAGARLMVAFLSNAYMRSDNCRKEMHYALSKKIPTINIFLEQTEMTPGMEMQVGNLFALMKYCMPEEDFYDKLLNAPQLNPELTENGVQSATPVRKSRKRKPVPIDLTVEAKKRKRKRTRRFVQLGAALVVLIAVAVLGIVGWSTGHLHRFQKQREQTELVPIAEDTVIVWTDDTLELIARDYSGISDGDLRVSDLTGLSTLQIRGDVWSFDNGALPEPNDTGGIQSLSDLQYFPDLNFLFLEDQSFSSLQSLSPCGIEYLILQDCEITSLRGIANLPLLRELDVLGCPLRELGDLGYCLQLRRLNLPGKNIRSFAEVKPLTELAEVDLSGCGLNELRVIFGLSSLSDVTLRDCDLRGRFFYAFDKEWNIVSLNLLDCKLNSTKNLDDFTGLTTISLSRTGESLDWSTLRSLPALKTVYTDSGMQESMRTMLEGTDVSLELISG